MYHEACRTTDLTGCVMIGLATLPASGMPTLTNCPSSEAEASWSSDCVLTTWPCTPLKLAALSNSNVLTYIVILVEDFCCAEGLYFLRTETHLAPLLHARQFHGVSSLNVNSEMVSHTVHAELMATFEGKKVLLVIVLVADIAKSSFTFLAWNRFSIDEILVKTFS